MSVSSLIGFNLDNGMEESACENSFEFHFLKNIYIEAIEGSIQPVFSTRKNIAIVAIRSKFCEHLVSKWRRYMLELKGL